MERKTPPWMSYSEMVAVVEEAAALLCGTRLRAVEQIAPYTWVFRFERASLLVVMKGRFARFHLSRLSLEGAAAPFARKLQGLQLEKIELVPGDRILLLAFAGGQICAFEFFPGGAFLLGPEYLPPPFAHPHEKTSSAVTSEALERRTLESMEMLFQEKWRLMVEKQCAKLAKAIEEGSCFSEVEHEAQLLQANLYRIEKGMASVEVEDWVEEGAVRTLTLDPLLSPAKQVEKRYKKARKLRRQLEIATQRLKELCASLDHPPPMPPPFAPKAKEQKALPYREYTTAAGLKIWVGKGARDNDMLTFRCAVGSDYWFHTADFPGSHVVLKVDKKSAPDLESILDALQLALYFSKARSNSADVLYTQCKYLSKPRGAKPGLVNTSRRKSRRVCPDQQRLDRLLSV